MTGPETRYHWMVTWQWQDGRGNLRSASRTGTAGAPPGVTREQLTQEILTASNPQPGGSSAVLFFSLEPDNLGAAS